MIITTTQFTEGQTIREYKGIVVGEATMCANIVRDFFVSTTDVSGGRSDAYEQKLADSRQIAEAELADEARARVKMLLTVLIWIMSLFAKVCSWCPCPAQRWLSRNETNRVFIQNAEI